MCSVSLVEEHVLELRYAGAMAWGCLSCLRHQLSGRQGCGVDTALPVVILSCLSSFPSLRLAQSLFALFASSLAISLVFAIIPLCHNVVVLAVVMAVAGLAMGCIDTISNMQLVKIYQKDSAIFLQVSVEPVSPLRSCFLL